MPLAPGRRLGPYEILSPLGAGGMGEVYRGRDGRLGRSVAIKVLPAEVARDPQRLKRFEQEARAASALNHPNIVTVYDIGETESVVYIAMELIDGKSLSEVLAWRPLPTKKLLEIAIQIADGLACAHEAGIIHRDLKPANVIVSKDGRVKILDFGLAKSPDPTGSENSTTTTQQLPPTRPGEVVGTVGYMSPEQASGEPLDIRSDQFSFGSVLYEMATGRRAFRGKTHIDTMTAILHSEPEPIAQVRPSVPAPLRWIIERCLAKAAADRFSSTRDLARDLVSLRDHLAEVSTDSGSASPMARSSTFGRRKRILLAMAAFAILSLTVVWLRLSLRPAPPPRSVRFTIAPPPNTTFNFGSSAPAPPAISPDGRWIAFGARDASGKNLIWLRPLDGVTAKLLAGTEGATYPFWSPDSASIGFFANGKLQRVDVNGGLPQTICNAPEGRGGSWGRDGTILFAPDPRSPITRVKASGGEPLAVTRLDPKRPNMVHRWPYFLPDGTHFLYFVHDPDRSLAAQGVWIGSVVSKEARLLLKVASNVVYSPPGYLMFVREGSLFTVAFDLAKLRLTGEPAPILGDVRYQPYRWNGVFSVSQTGVLAYQTGLTLETSQLAWFDRSGKQVGTLGTAADYEGLRLSPDGSRCAVEVRDPHTGTIDIWIGDVSRGVTTRLTSGEAINDSPVWSPDGERVVFSSNRTGHFALYRIASRGGEADQVILRSEDGISPTDWSFDGRQIAFQESGPSTSYRWELWKLTLPEGKPSRLLQPVANQKSARFSANGRWVAYSSDESGNQEVYVQAAAGTGGKWQITQSGGSQPVWGKDGTEIFFLAPDNKVIAAQLSEDPSLRVVAVRPLFEARVRDSASDIPVFDVSPNSQRFLINTRVEGQPDPPLTVVLNWVSGLRP